MKHLLEFFTVLMLTLILTTSCNDNNDDNKKSNIVTFKATLNGANERPNPVTTSATGSATVTYNKVTKTFTVTGTYTGMTATASHIHGPATTENAAGVKFGLTASEGTISYSGSDVLTSTEETELNNGLYYINVHSSTYPAGEIRGQLIATTTPGGNGSGDGGGSGY